VETNVYVMQGTHLTIMAAAQNVLLIPLQAEINCDVFVILPPKSLIPPHLHAPNALSIQVPTPISPIVNATLDTYYQSMAPALPYSIVDPIRL
jgi:hypothetical protein